MQKVLFPMFFLTIDLHKSLLYWDMYALWPKNKEISRAR